MIMMKVLVKALLLRKYWPSIEIKEIELPNTYIKV